MNEDKIKELFSNEEFVKGLFKSGSYEAAQAKLAAEGLETTVDELKEVKKLLSKKAAGELSDEELEEVSGGAGIGTWLLFGTIVGCVTGWYVDTVIDPC